MTVCGQSVIVMNSRGELPLENVLLLNRKITSDDFFEPSLSGLHDPFLMPDMDKAVNRILEARRKGERIVIF
jgi:single-stranded-DNA-specific exonuclease